MIVARCLAVVGALGLVVCSLVAEDNAIVPDGATLEQVRTGGSFTEGPAYGPDHCVYFSDIGNRMSTIPNNLAAFVT